MNFDINPLRIPFLKFKIDPALTEHLELIKYELINPWEPEELFLLQHKSGDNYTYICVYVPQDGNHGEDNARTLMTDFVESKKEFFKMKDLEFVYPKHDDFYPEHLIAIVKEQRLDVSSS